ncbi:hypothetical protein QVD17_19960 [Tagetes erecta]|uniref:Reverse transcriptase n=1 Tax=Tagetes erecta TaxID=13708 RepID=A0AAD8KKK6_TARER|nr:hypothetical protein QVD17_19960 [Tagetes erecta]
MREAILAIGRLGFKNQSRAPGLERIATRVDGIMGDNPSESVTDSVGIEEQVENSTKDAGLNDKNTKKYADVVSKGSKDDREVNFRSLEPQTEKQGTSSSYNRFQVLEDKDNERINIGTTSRSIAEPEGGGSSDDDCENVFDETAEFLLSNDDQLLRDTEAKCILDYQTACLDEESFLKQKSKVHWLAKGDANTRFFHNYLKGKNHRSRIHSIMDSNGITWEGDLMIDAFVLHYKNFLGGQHNASLHPTDDIFVNSTVYFCHVPPRIKSSITSLIPFEEGELPVRYLGVPLITKRLCYSDCTPLIDRMDKRINLWMNKFLSFAGRLQLIRSVLSSLHVYWASVLFLPSRISMALEKKMRNFLWGKSDHLKGNAKVAWKKVCFPKCEGGLGIRRIGDMNKALMATHIWKIILNQESLWVKWVHSVRLRGHKFWEVKVPGSCSWSWRNILSVRDSIKGYIWSKAKGNGG